MIRRIICILWGHKWKQQGFTTVNHYCDGIFYKKRDHYLFLCQRCCKIKEHHCDFAYDEVDENTEDQ